MVYTTKINNFINILIFNYSIYENLIILIKILYNILIKTYII